MRGKKTVINTIMSLVEEIVAVICAFILPRLILSAFGSKYNGLISSITQFLACATLLRAGIGGATRAALYKPLASRDESEVSSIIKATDIFMKKIGIIMGLGIVGFAAVYPFLVHNEFSWLFTFSLFIIIGLSTYAETFFGITYLILLQADQRLWVSSVLKSVCYILNTVLAAALILNGKSILVVKFVSALVFILYPICLQIYVKKFYRLDKLARPDNSAISQRWDAFWQQVAVFAMNNTDVIVLTVFSNMLEVSVYSIYSLVVNGLRRAVFAFSNGLEAAFGSMIANQEHQTLKRNVSVVELVIYAISTIVYVTAILSVLQFVRIYTKGIHDVNYIRPAFAVVLLVAQFFNSVRLPYQLVVQAAGHYKQTKNGAIIEPIINLVISILIVRQFGLIGVAIGTLCATVFRTIQYSYYMSKNIVKRGQLITLRNCLISLLETIVIVLIYKVIPFSAPGNYLSWALQALMTVLYSTLVVVSTSYLFYRRECQLLVKKLRGLLFRN